MDPKLKNERSATSKWRWILSFLFKNEQTKKSAAYELLRDYFDEDYYRKRYKDVPEDADLLEHYLTLGWHQERDPANWFSTSSYLEANPDVKESGLNPFLHYIKYGRGEERPLKRDKVGQPPKTQVAPQKAATKRPPNRAQPAGRRDPIIVKSLAVENDVLRFEIASLQKELRKAAAHLAEVRNQKVILAQRQQELEQVLSSIRN